MCLILVAWRSHPDFPCIIAANRDEFHARPAAAAHWWADRPQILAGRDLTAGGTWLGMTREGRFAALTNHRSARPMRPGSPSRGELVTAVLESSTEAVRTLQHVAEVGARYNEFNLLFSDGATLCAYESVTGAGRELGPGIYGLSNHLLDTAWPKVRLAKERLGLALRDPCDTLPLLELLRDDRPAADADLPRTGVSLERERSLSSAFIRGEEYGTRCSTVIRRTRTGTVLFDEWSWDRAGVATGHTGLRFDVAAQGAALESSSGSVPPSREM